MRYERTQHQNGQGWDAERALAERVGKFGFYDNRFGPEIRIGQMQAMEEGQPWLSLMADALPVVGTAKGFYDVI